MGTEQENTQDIFVKQANQAYSTNKVRGHTASSTSGMENAARRLAEKLYGPALRRVIEIAPGNTFVCLWRAFADPTMVAWCWATGQIEFGDQVPEDALEIARGPDRALREKVAVAARHAKPRSAGQFLVPGVPEAGSQSDKADALNVWLAWCGKCHNGNRHSFGVSFYPHKVVPK